MHFSFSRLDADARKHIPWRPMHCHVRVCRRRLHLELAEPVLTEINVASKRSHDDFRELLEWPDLQAEHSKASTETKVRQQRQSDVDGVEARDDQQGVCLSAQPRVFRVLCTENRLKSLRPPQRVDSAFHRRRFERRERPCKVRSMRRPRIRGLCSGGGADNRSCGAETLCHRRVNKPTARLANKRTRSRGHGRKMQHASERVWPQSASQALLVSGDGKGRQQRRTKA